MVKATLIIPAIIFPFGNFFFFGPSCGKRISPKRYKAIPKEHRIHIPIKTSLLMKPQFSTKSALDKNLNANPNSKNPRTTFTVFNQPPLFGSLFNQFGNIANNANGNANASPNPDIPTVSCQAPPSLVKDPPSSAPNIGPVQEKETIAKVSAIKKTPINPPTVVALLSIFAPQEAGNVIS